MRKDTIPVYLNREKYDVSKDVSYPEFRSILKIPSGRALYLRDKGKLIEVTEENFLLRPGQHYFDVPDWVEGKEGEAEPLPPLLTEDLNELKRDFGGEKIKVTKLDNSEWEISVSDFPTTPNLQNIYGKGVIKFKVSMTYPQAPITGLNFTSPTEDIQKGCFNCSEWDQQSNGIITYLCGVQKWMEAKKHGR